MSDGKIKKGGKDVTSKKQSDKAEAIDVLIKSNIGQTQAAADSRNQSLIVQLRAAWEQAQKEIPPKPKGKNLFTAS